MDFKPFAQSAQAFDGQITFWILPFTTPLQDVRHSRLDDFDREYEYVNDKTGKVTSEAPDEYRKSMLRARDMNVPGWQFIASYGGWTARRRWTRLHDNFLLYDTHTVAIDFTLNDDAPADLRLFEAYWSDCKDAPLQERFEAFGYAVSERVHDAWKAAFDATRDNPAPGKAELGEAPPDKSADPNELGGGEPPTTATNEPSTKSEKPKPNRSTSSDA